MLRKLSLTLLLACSGCATGPKVTVLVSDPAKGGMESFNENTGKRDFMPYSATDKFVCLTPPDAEALLNYCKAGEAVPAR